MLIAKLKSFEKRHHSSLFMVEMFLVLFLFALVAVSGQAKAEDTKLYATTRSVHYEDNGRYNNNNWGIMLEHQTDSGKRFAIGGYKNSFGNPVLLVAHEVATLYEQDSFKVAAVSGAAIGYEAAPIIPSMALTIDVDYVKLTVTPVVTNLSFRIAEF